MKALLGNTEIFWVAALRSRDRIELKDMACMQTVGSCQWGLYVPFVLLACRSPLCANSSVSHKLETDSSFSELILNEMKTQVIMFGSLPRQQALSASLMINTAAGNVLQLVDQFNDAKIWLHLPPALTNTGISFFFFLKQWLKLGAPWIPHLPIYMRYQEGGVVFLVLGLTQV